MAERRELTERNRENQQPGQPIDFCQGLPFKVRWMGRDAQTGRDLVQFPDGSIVRAGKRIFSGNCPRGTMVDVVDCGSNGFITIDWRDAEIREPLPIPGIAEKIRIIVDTGFTRYASNNPFRTDNEERFLANVKGMDSVLLVAHFSDMNNPLFDLPEKTVPSLEGLTIQDLSDYQQIWIISSPNPILDNEVALVLTSKKNLFLLADNDPLLSVNGILRKKYNLSEDVLTGSFGPVGHMESDRVFLLEDELFTGVSQLSGGFSISSFNNSLVPDFKVIANTEADEAELIPTIAVLR